MDRDLDAIFYCRNVPIITFEDGHFHVAYDVGKRARFEFVFTPAKFLKMRAAAAKIVEQFHAGGKVLPLRKTRA